MRKLALVDNRSGYATADLARFLERELRDLRIQRPIHVVVVPSPIFSRGCADVGTLRCSGGRCRSESPRRMVLAIARPGRQSPEELRRRLYCLVRHETWHVEGYNHERMPERILYSEGAAPPWALAARLSWRGAPPRPTPRFTNVRG